jgi:hypothetical protein
MRILVCCAVLSVLSVQATPIQAQTTTNRVRLPATNRPRLTVTNNIAAARSTVPQSAFGSVALNTPAFEEYGFNLMLTYANMVREKWQMDIPKPLAVPNVSFYLKATGQGIDGALGTRDKRYNWAFAHNTLQHFTDTKYYPRFWFTATGYDTNKLNEVAEIQSKITLGGALKIARNSLHELGLSEKELKLREPPIVSQISFEDADNKKHYLPLFKIGWTAEDGPEDSEFLVIHVSGITTNVAEYFNVCLSTPRIPMATNYFEMLGVKPPENERQRQGLERLTPLAK